MANTTSKAPAYRVEVTFTDGSVTRSPRFTFQSIAASSVVALRKNPDVRSATVLTVA